MSTGGAGAVDGGTASADWAAVGAATAGALAGAAGGDGAGATIATSDDLFASVDVAGACASLGSAGFSTGFGCSFAVCGTCADFGSAGRAGTEVCGLGSTGGVASFAGAVCGGVIAGEPSATTGCLALPSVDLGLAAPSRPMSTMMLRSSRKVRTCGVPLSVKTTATVSKSTSDSIDLSVAGNDALASA